MGWSLGRPTPTFRFWSITRPAVVTEATYRQPIISWSRRPPLAKSSTSGLRAVGARPISSASTRHLRFPQEVHRLRPLAVDRLLTRRLLRLPVTSPRSFIRQPTLPRDRSTG